MNQRRTGWSIQLGTISQIPIRIHVTFLILLVWFMFDARATSPIREGLFVCVIFGCVLLHELGHALTAKRFGILTRDITLYPFGGIASITSQPTAKAELLIAIAGPLVNIAIAGMLYPWISVPDLSKPPSLPLSFVTQVFITNLALAIFNLLPALPMDGGRVLRAILTIIKVQRPTAIAARVSQVLCVLLAISALYIHQPMLFLIAWLIFFGAMQEHVRAQSKVVAANFSVADAMIPRERLEILAHGTTISKALHLTITSLQPLFPIMNGDELLGVAYRDDILEHAASRPDDYVGEIMIRELPKVDVHIPLNDALAQFEQAGTPLVVVTRDGVFAGVLLFDRVADLLMLHEIRHNAPKDDDTAWSMPD